VEKGQYKLCLEVLRRFSKCGLLGEIVLIGSWCVPFYKDYFEGVRYDPAIRTRDIDFLIPVPSRIKQNVDIPHLLSDLGFLIRFQGGKGYMKLEHPELIVEFLTPEKSRGTDEPVPLPRLGVNAVALRFLNLLTDNVIQVKVENFKILLPHPAYFALHKLIIAQRRTNPEKSAKDKKAALGILRALIDKGDTEIIKSVVASLPPKWKKKIVAGVAGIEESNVLASLT